MQAGQAAFQEIDTLIKRSRVGEPVPVGTEFDTIELADEDALFEQIELKPAVGGGKVIPLRRR